jgi:hypothetical protein
MGPTARARLTPREGRTFAWTLAAAFGVLAALLLWRDRETGARVLAIVAAVCFLAGAVAPTRLGPLRAAWMAFGVALSRITSPVFFTLIYMVVFAPAGLLRRRFSRSPLARDKSAASYWIARDPAATDRSRLERQF